MPQCGDYPDSVPKSNGEQYDNWKPIGALARALAEAAARRLKDAAE